MSETPANYDTKKTGLARLREPFLPAQISKLPKGTKAQNECAANEKKNCAICGGWHHPKIIHLDYVGHAALTARLLECDEMWNWEPFAVGPDGYPVIDKDGGMWIKMTVCGVTRLGYGDAQGKTGGNAMKERIGDALRNAAMRFGAALDLWHKGDNPLFGDEPEERKDDRPTPVYDKALVAGWMGMCTEAAEKKDIALFRAWFDAHKGAILSDCKAEGLEVVRLHWVAEGVKLAKA
jgi:hypothetical protein